MQAGRRQHSDVARSRLLSNLQHSQLAPTPRTAERTLHLFASPAGIAPSDDRAVSSKSCEPSISSKPHMARRMVSCEETLNNYQSTVQTEHIEIARLQAKGAKECVLSWRTPTRSSWTAEPSNIFRAIKTYHSAG